MCTKEQAREIAREEIEAKSEKWLNSLREDALTSLQEMAKKHETAQSTLDRFNEQEKACIKTHHQLDMTIQEVKNMVEKVHGSVDNLNNHTKNYIKRDEAWKKRTEERYAGKWVEKVLIWLGIVAGGLIVTAIINNILQ